MNGRATPDTAVDVGWKLGLLLGGVQVINHSLDVFASLQPPLPAIRGVAMWAVVFLVCGAASSIAYGRTHTLRFGIIASILASVGGAAILVVYAIAVGVRSRFRRLRAPAGCIWAVPRSSGSRLVW